MLVLKVSPPEFAAMILFLRRATEGYRQQPLSRQSVNVLVMGQYLAKWNEQRLLNWTQRKFDKAYPLPLPLPVARALHEDMQTAYLGNYQQQFLFKLDQGIINYRNPFGWPHVMGELISQSALV